MTLPIFRRGNRLGQRNPPLLSIILRVLFILILLVLGHVIWSVHQWNQSYVDKELEAPLDHWSSNLWKPLYSLGGCPTIVDDDATTDDAQDLPPMLMISARPKHLVDPVLQSWTKAGFPIQLVNTSQISQDYTNTRCQTETFKSRLFAIYQHVFRQTIEQSTSSSQQQHDDDFRAVVTIEDDVMLLDPTQFRRELLYVYHQAQWDYYSFTRNSPRDTCLYRFGTPAQLWGRRMMEQVLDVDDDVFCRLPIDMFVAQQGPWYVTQHQLVKHIGKRVVLN